MLSLHSIPVERAARPFLPLRIERAIRAFNDYHHRPVILLVENDVVVNVQPMPIYDEDLDPWPPYAITNWNHETAFGERGWTDEIEEEYPKFDWNTMVQEVRYATP
jgi:hypothetical protein